MESASDTPSISPIASRRSCRCHLVATHHSVLFEVKALERLVEDLLHLARSDNHTSELKREPVDVDDLVLGEARRLRVDTSLLIDTSAVSAAQVVGDPDQLSRAIRNLCDNAASHATTLITLTTREVHGRAELRVNDDGPGIPEHERSRVFERFARIDEARHTASGGTGLGLAITLDIIEGHGGTITIQEAEGGGASFVVSLPASEPPSAATTSRA